MRSYLTLVGLVLTFSMSILPNYSNYDAMAEINHLVDSYGGLANDDYLEFFNLIR